MHIFYVGVGFRIFLKIFYNSIGQNFSNFSSERISEMSVVGEAWLSIFLLMREMCSFGAILVHIER